jgi:hypothetical protein
MKKLLKSFFVLATLAVLTFQISGCKKDCPVPPTVTYSIRGLWEGTMTDAANQTAFLSIKTNGTCTLENISPGTQENFNYGIWNLTGNTLTCTLTCPYGYLTNIGLQETFTGTFDSKLGTIKGTFHLVSPAGLTDDGTFSLTKAN